MTVDLAHDAPLTKTEVAEALSHLRAAMRNDEFKVRKYTDDPPTPNEVHHSEIDRRLDEWLAAPS